MKDSGTGESLEWLVGAAVSVEPGDVQALAAMHAAFGKIAAEADGDRDGVVGRISAWAQSGLEMVIMEDHKDPRSMLMDVARAAGALREVLVEGRMASEASWPSAVHSLLEGSGNGAGIVPDAGEGPEAPSSPPTNRMVDDGILREFLGRQIGVMEDLEEAILDMEKAAGEGAGETILRILHNVKGESGLLGLSEAERLCHAVEDCLGSGERPEMAEALLMAKDWLAKCFRHLSGNDGAPGPIDSILQSLAAGPAADCALEDWRRGGPSPEEFLPFEEGVSPDADPGVLSDFINEAQEHLDQADQHLLALESDPSQSEAIDAVFRAFHSIKGVAGFLALRGIQSYGHESESLLDLVRQGKWKLDPATMDLVFEAVDMLKKRITWLREQGTERFPHDQAVLMAESMRRLKAASGRGAGSRTREKSREPVPAGSAGDGEAMRAGARSGGTRPVEMPAKGVEASAREQAALHGGHMEVGGSRSPGGSKETVKVEAERLDKLLDAIGELVIAESMIIQSPELKGKVSSRVIQQLALLDKITRDLQKMGTSLRMIPVRPVFQKMARLVRDLSHKNGKAVEFVSKGEETELDKTVVDKIGDPLVHMIRNAVDHGIEGPEERGLSSKPAHATVRLSAYQKGGSVCIEVCDDGRGLNRDAILRKARDRGLINHDGSALQDHDVWKFIFEPGFSTAKVVTEVSGRGVGMDVVRRNIEDLRGRVDIRSRPGEGTTFSIWLPLTLAIIDGMIVRLDRERFIFPTLSILRVVTLRPEDLSTVAGRGELIDYQGEMIPVFRLDRLFAPGSSALDAKGERLAVIVESGGRKAALPVDELLGQQQIVIKGLGETLKQIEGLAGGAILADGCVGIILDVDGLMKAIAAEIVSN